MHPAIIANMNFKLFSYKLIDRPRVPGVEYRTSTLDFGKVILAVMMAIVAWMLIVTAADWIGYKSRADYKAENKVLVEKVDQVVEINKDIIEAVVKKEEAVKKADETFVVAEKKSQVTQEKIVKVKDKFVKESREIQKTPELTFEEKEFQMSEKLIDAIWEGYELIEGTPQ